MKRSVSIALSSIVLVTLISLRTRADDTNKFWPILKAQLPFSFEQPPMRECPQGYSSSPPNWFRDLYRPPIWTRDLYKGEDFEREIRSLTAPPTTLACWATKRNSGIEYFSIRSRENRIFQAQVLWGEDVICDPKAFSQKFGLAPTNFDGRHAGRLETGSRKQSDGYELQSLCTMEGTQYSYITQLQNHFYFFILSKENIQSLSNRIKGMLDKSK